MPFTISHAAIVAPLYRLPKRYASLSGLIIGSMVPDFLYFFRLNPYADDGHHFPGILIYDLPLAILIAYAWHHWWRYPLMDYAPPFAAARLRRYRFFNWHQYFCKHFLVVICSVMVGVFSHLFLDAFTHEQGYFVQNIPFLLKNSGTQPNWYLMQYATSIIGLPILFYYFSKIPVKKPLPHITLKDTLFFWIGTAVLSFLILYINEQLHYIACKGLDYLAVILGGVMYGYIAMAAAYTLFIKRS
ncbi:DUF4184 family protein [Chitinophaga sp. Hz27]|uniref:DUF4184 family protein n=1 Tax=Chitinophaga sp. Hz27 TaxID=3347169 RepID=UPI0035DFED59